MTASSIQHIKEKFFKGERLSYEDGVALYASNDLFAIADMANHIRRQKSGRQVFFNVNRHINYSNICKLSCSFCAFQRKEGDEGAYTFSVNQILERAQQASLEGATELHMVGGLHPTAPFSYYLEFLSAIKKNFPQLHLKCFTAIEIIHLSKVSGLSIKDTLLKLKEAGLDSMPGGGAEIFHPEVRKKICPEKETADEWLAVHKQAHEIGFKTNATMLYGMVEKPEHRVDHVLRLRELQDQTGGFQAFIPLAFHPKTNEKGVDGIWSTGLNDIKTYAISRILLDNFQHVKVYWSMLGLKLAQIMLGFGVDDFDGTVMEEKIYHEAGSDMPQSINAAYIQKLIKEAGYEPVERDTLYRKVIRSGKELTYA